MDRDRPSRAWCHHLFPRTAFIGGNCDLNDHADVRCYPNSDQIITTQRMHRCGISASIRSDKLFHRREAINKSDIALTLPKPRPLSAFGARTDIKNECRVASDPKGTNSVFAIEIRWNREKMLPVLTIFTYPKFHCAFEFDRPILTVKLDPGGMQNAQSNHQWKIA